MKKRGVGIGCMLYGTGYGNGFPDAASAFVEIHDDGTASVLVGAVDVGQGSNTIFAQIAAEELGLTPEEITVITGDTDVTPDAGTTAATRVTYIGGNAVRKAAQAAKQPLLEWAAGELGVNTADGLVLKDHRIMVKGFPQKSLPVAEAAFWARLRGRRLVGEGTAMTHTTALDPETGQGAPYWPYAFATQIVEVEVDTETGKVEVLRVVAAHDVGRAVNPTSVDGQIAGGFSMGLGYALMEEVQLAMGRIANPSMATYLIPTSLDMPEVMPVIVESEEPSGPYGAKGVGEPALIPAAPAILNAIYDAIGVRIYDLPATPEKILAALAEKTAGKCGAINAFGVKGV
ncbi:MAG: xanthine dehydrogenase family protein molybdopterin-binding subunit [Syntrophothermus sp.]